MTHKLCEVADNTANGPPIKEMPASQYLLIRQNMGMERIVRVILDWWDREILCSPNRWTCLAHLSSHQLLYLLSTDLEDFFRKISRMLWVNNSLRWQSRNPLSKEQFLAGSLKSEGNFRLSIFIELTWQARKRNVPA